MKFTSYSVLFQDSYTKRFETVSSFHLTKQAALNWINLDKQWSIDFKQGKIKIQSHREDSKNFVESDRKQVEKDVREALQNV